jgi:hypothetical protein
MGSHLVFTLGSILLAGCASHNADFEPPPDHPANPAAAEAFLPPPSGTLALAPTGAREAAPADEPKDAAGEHGDANHQHGEHAGHGISQDAMPEQGSSDAGHAYHGSVPSADGHAATTTSPAPVGAGPTKTIYVCPMHKQVQSDKPGKCPICKTSTCARCTNRCSPTSPGSVRSAR